MPGERHRHRGAETDAQTQRPGSAQDPRRKVSHRNRPKLQRGLRARSSGAVAPILASVSH